MLVLLKSLLPFINLLITVLNKWLDGIEKAKAKKEQEDAQKNRDKIEDNPVDWLNEHFDGGVRGKEDRSKTNPLGPDKAND